MGGNAFASLDPPIHPVRLPTPLYTKLRDHHIGLLSQLFYNVSTPREAPEKSTHGDIDILVSGPKPSILDSSDSICPLPISRAPPHDSSSDSDGVTQADIGLYLPAIKTLIKPTAHIHQRNAPSISLAMKLGTPPTPPSSGPKEAGAARQDPTDYFQMDITLIPSSPPSLFTWNLLLNSYGDLFSILGISLRSLGLIANPSGLFLVSEELESQGRKRGRLLLTREVDKALEFLGITPLEVLQPNATYQERVKLKGVDKGARMEVTRIPQLFSLISESLYFDPGAYTRFSKPVKEMRGSDRQRMERPLFRRFMQEHLIHVILKKEDEARNKKTKRTKRKRVDTPPVAAAEDELGEEEVPPPPATPADSIDIPAVPGPAPRDPEDRSPDWQDTASSSSSDETTALTREYVRDTALWHFNKHTSWDKMHKAVKAAEGEEKQKLPKLGTFDSGWSKGVRREEAEMWHGYSRAWLDYMGIREAKVKTEETSTKAWNYQYVFPDGYPYQR